MPRDLHRVAGLAENRKATRRGLPTLTGVTRSLYVRVAAWATLVTQVLIVGTGGAVRLTGSGLGCPTWPLCTDASLVATPEMGVHGAIEFGNRLLSIVVGIVAVALVALVIWRLRSRRDVLIPAIAILALTVLQGFVGGISVRVRLDPAVVGLHFLASVVLVALSTVVVYRVMRGRRGARAVPGWFSGLTHLTSAAVAVTVVVGVLTTGSGPHAGDTAAARNGLDSEFLQHVHSWPAYATFALTLALVVLAFIRRLPVRGWVLALLGVEVVQIAVGLVQANTGLPPLLVGTHMVLACILVAVMTATVLSLRASVRETDAEAGRVRQPGTPASST